MTHRYNVEIEWDEDAQCWVTTGKTSIPGLVVHGKTIQDIFHKVSSLGEDLIRANKGWLPAKAKL